MKGTCLMNKPDHNCKITVTEDGPYIVTGSVPLSEKIIAQTSKGYVYHEGRELPQDETYALCRCGKTKTPPFCDGSHTRFDFDGEETASRSKFVDRAEFQEGPELDLLDDRSINGSRTSSEWAMLARSTLVLMSPTSQVL